MSGGDAASPLEAGQQQLSPVGSIGGFVNHESHRAKVRRRIGSFVLTSAAVFYICSVEADNSAVGGWEDANADADDLSVEAAAWLLDKPRDLTVAMEYCVGHTAIQSEYMSRFPHHHHHRGPFAVEGVWKDSLGSMIEREGATGYLRAWLDTAPFFEKAVQRYKRDHPCEEGPPVAAAASEATDGSGANVGAMGDNGSKHSGCIASGGASAAGGGHCSPSLPASPLTAADTAAGDSAAVQSPPSSGRGTVVATAEVLAHVYQVALESLRFPATDIDDADWGVTQEGWVAAHVLLRRLISIFRLRSGRVAADSAAVGRIAAAVSQSSNGCASKGKYTLCSVALAVVDWLQGELGEDITQQQQPAKRTGHPPCSCRECCGGGAPLARGWALACLLSRMNGLAHLQFRILPPPGCSRGTSSRDTLPLPAVHVRAACRHWCPRLDSAVVESHPGFPAGPLDDDGQDMALMEFVADPRRWARDLARDGGLLLLRRPAAHPYVLLHPASAVRSVLRAATTTEGATSDAADGGGGMAWLRGMVSARAQSAVERIDARMVAGVGEGVLWGRAAALASGVVAPQTTATTTTHSPATAGQRREVAGGALSGCFVPVRPQLVEALRGISGASRFSGRCVFAWSRPAPPILGSVLGGTAAEAIEYCGPFAVLLPMEVLRTAWSAPAGTPPPPLLAGGAAAIVPATVLYAGTVAACPPPHHAHHQLSLRADTTGAAGDGAVGKVSISIRVDDTVVGAVACPPASALVVEGAAWRRQLRSARWVWDLSRQRAGSDEGGRWSMAAAAATVAQVDLLLSQASDTYMESFIRAASDAHREALPVLQQARSATATGGGPAAGPTGRRGRVPWRSDVVAPLFPPLDSAAADAISAFRDHLVQQTRPVVATAPVVFLRASSSGCPEENNGSDTSPAAPAGAAGAEVDPPSSSAADGGCTGGVVPFPGTRRVATTLRRGLHRGRWPPFFLRAETTVAVGATGASNLHIQSLLQARHRVLFTAREQAEAAACASECASCLAVVAMGEVRSSAARACGAGERTFILQLQQRGARPASTSVGFGVGSRPLFKISEAEEGEEEGSEEEGTRADAAAATLKMSMWAFASSWPPEPLVQLLLMPPLVIAVDDYFRELGTATPCLERRAQTLAMRVRRDLEASMLAVFTSDAVRERLEFCGDGLVNLISACDVLLARDSATGEPTWSSGGITRTSENAHLRANLAGVVQQAVFAASAGLVNPKTYADFVEALFGAVVMAAWVMPLVRGRRAMRRRSLLRDSSESSTTAPQSPHQSPPPRTPAIVSESGGGEEEPAAVAVAVAVSDRFILGKATAALEVERPHFPLMASMASRLQCMLGVSLSAAALPDDAGASAAEGVAD